MTRKISDGIKASLHPHTPDSTLLPCGQRHSFRAELSSRFQELTSPTSQTVEVVMEPGEEEEEPRKRPSIRDSDEQ